MSINKVLLPYLLIENMRYISDIPIIDLAIQAEEKHGEETHMVIEIVPKNEVEENMGIDSLTEDDVLWWVEFENEQKVFDNFDMVTHYLLNEVEKTK